MITPKANSHLKNILSIGILSFGLIPVISRPAHAQATHISQDWSLTSTGYSNDSLREFLPRLRAALDSANKNPEQKQPLTFKATVNAAGRTGIRHLRIRNFQFLSDGSEGSGEYNLGPGSWPTIVGVLGSSVAQDYLIQATARNIPIDSLEVVFTSTPGPAPSWNGRTITYPRDLAYTAYIVSSATDAQLEDLRKTVEKESAVLNLVREKQDIPHAELVYTETPKDRGVALAGLRDFLEGKRNASRRPRVAGDAAPPAGAQPTAGAAPVAGVQPTAGAAPAAGAPAGGAQPASDARPQGGRRGGRNRGEAAAPRTAGSGANENAPLRAVVKVEGGTGIRHIRTDDSNFQIIHDFPAYLGGHNLGPVAEEHILGVMTTCLTHIFEIQAANRGVALDSLRLETEGTLSPRVGSTTQSPRFSKIHYTAHIGSPESKETVAALVEAVEGACPIYNLLRNANEVDGKLVRGHYKEPVKTAAAN